jgi:hypothetical protein
MPVKDFANSFYSGGATPDRQRGCSFEALSPEGGDPIDPLRLFPDDRHQGRLTLGRARLAHAVEAFARAVAVSIAAATTTTGAHL